MPAESVSLSLRQEDARLVFLAIAYHLGRPGSELDPMTKQPVEHGLAEVARELQPQLRLAVATISLNPDQVTRLVSGMAGSVTELKAYPMLELRADSGRRSTVPGFDSTLRHLFPEVDEDAENAYDIAERMLMLRRRLSGELGLGRRAAIEAQSATTPPAATSRRRRWWPFGR
ncbi:MAG TPA: hypothetical protein VNN10_09840 [Dehalococcoidia bacterium]|nr:hypothetical protein [Dehalococcoidia bacterium]